MIGRVEPIRRNGVEPSGVISRTETAASFSEMAAATPGPAYRLELSGKSPEKETFVPADLLRMQDVDTSIRMHEAAHQRAGGGYTGGVSYVYQKGINHREYVSGGEVSIAVPLGTSPEETLRNMRRVKQAALAPADPSPQDLRVALQAAAVMARMEGQLQAAQEGVLDAGGDFPHSIEEFIVSQATRMMRWNDTEGAAAYVQQTKEREETLTGLLGEWAA